MMLDTTFKVSGNVGLYNSNLSQLQAVKVE